MKSKKFIIFGAAAILALVGCSNMASGVRYNEVQKATTDNQDGTYTATYTIAEIADGYDWVDTTAYNDAFPLQCDKEEEDQIIFVSSKSGNNNGKYYVNGEQYRLYQTGGGNITVSVKDSLSETYTIQTVSFAYVSEKGGNLLYNNTIVSSGNNVTINNSTATFNVGNNGTATNGQARITEISVKYALATSPSVSISGESYTKIGSTIAFTPVIENLDNPSIVWTSSNTNIATINENGVLNPVAMGTTTVSMTADGHASNEIEVKVYPDNSQDISVTTALGVCELVGGSNVNAPYDYSCVATVSDNTASNHVTLKDLNNDNVIPAYGINGTLFTVGQKLRVTGHLYNYKGTTAEFNQTDIQYQTYHTITFNPDNGSSNTVINDVLSGTLLEKPEDPVKDGATFIGWFNGEDEWNFDTDTISGDLTLIAKWHDAKEEAMQNELNQMNSYFSLAYKYDISENDFNTTLVMKNSLTGDGAEITNSSLFNENLETTLPSNISYVSSSKVYKGKDSSLKFGSSSAAGDLKLSTKFLKVTRVIINAKAWKAGTVAGLILNGSEVQQLTDSYANYSFDLDNVDSLEIKSAAKAGTITDPRIYIKSIQIVGSEESFNDVDVRIKTATDSFATFLSNNPSVSEYGLEVSTTSKTKKYNYATSVYEETKQEKDYQFQVISLGDAINNPSRLEEKFTIRAYAKYGEDYYYSALTKTHSVVDLVETYYESESTRDMITPLYNVLVDLGKIQ